MISIVLVEPEHSGNIGAVARVMKNFGFSKLVLINPKCNHLDGDSLRRSKHATNVLKKAEVGKKALLRKYDYLIATTARIGTDYNIPRSPVVTEDLYSMMNKKSNIAILFGRESNGLTNAEVRKCDFSVTIPASTKYSTLNLSHAVTIVLYELFKQSKKKKSYEQHALATAKEKEIALKLIDEVLKRTDFATKEKRDTQRKVWKRVLGKAQLTKREAFAVIGFFRKI